MVRNSIDKFSEPKNACEWLEQDGYSDKVVNACNQYSSVCGNGSSAAQALEISEQYDPYDEHALTEYNKLLQDAKKSKSECHPSMKCGQIQSSEDPSKKIQVNCLPFLSCTSGACQ